MQIVNDIIERRRPRWLFGRLSKSRSARDSVIRAEHRFRQQQRAQQPEPPKPGAPAARAS